MRIKKKNEVKITGKGANKNPSRIKINPVIAESNIGATLLEIVELDEVDSIFRDLSESEIFLLSDSLIEQTVNEFFIECFEEGYDLDEVENIILESIELTESILIEENVTYGHDTEVKQNRLQKVKNAIKGAGKAVARSVGYVAGATVRGAKAIGREIRSGYARGRSGSASQSAGSSSSVSRPASTTGSSSTPSSSTSNTSSSSSSAPSSSTSTQSSTPTSSGSGSSKPGFFSRIGSALKSGLKRVIAGGARKVARGAIGIARRMEKEKPHPVHSRIGSLPPKAPPSGAGQRDRFASPSRSSTSATTSAAPSQTTSSAPTSRPIPRSSRTSSQSSSTRQTTPSTPPKSQAPVGSSENPRVGQPAKETKPSPTPATSTSSKPASAKGKDKPQTSTPATPATPAAGKGKKSEQTPVANPPQAQTGTAKVTGKGKRKGKKNSEENQNPKIGNAPDLDTLLKMEQLSLDERRLSSAESRQREHIVKSMKSRRSDFERRYPGRGEEVMFATATKMAKKIAEQLATNNKMNQQNSTQQNQQNQQNQQKPAQQKSLAQKAKASQIKILTNKLSAVKSTPAGAENDISV